MFDEKKIATIDNLLSKNSGFLIWASCIEKPREAKEIAKLFAIKSDMLYKGKIRELLEKEGLIEVTTKKRKNFDAYVIKSKTDWLSEYPSKELLNDNGSLILLLFANDLFSKFFKLPAAIRKEFFSSEIFRKNAFVIEEYKKLFQVTNLFFEKSFEQIKEGADKSLNPSNVQFTWKNIINTSIIKLFAIYNYKTDLKTKKIFSKISKTKSEDLLSSISKEFSIQSLRTGEVVNDEDLKVLKKIFG